MVALFLPRVYALLSFSRQIFYYVALAGAVLFWVTVVIAIIAAP